MKKIKKSTDSRPLPATTGGKNSEEEILLKIKKLLEKYEKDRKP